MLRLHGLLHHSQQVLANLLQVHFLAQPGAESGDGLLGVVFLAVEAPVYIALDAAAQGGEQDGDEQGGDNGDDRRLLTAVRVPHLRSLKG